MDYRKFNFDNDNYKITVTINTYDTNGKNGFKTTPTETETQTVNARFYTNYITAIPFFNNFGFGASCRATYKNTIAGRLPTIITTISPYRETKKQAIFTFEPLTD